MAKKLTFRKRPYTISGLNDLSESVSTVVSQLNAIPPLSGQLIEDITLSSGQNTVTHRLGSRARGAMVVMQSASGSVSVLPSKNSSEIYLSTTVAMTVSVWVF